MVILINPPWIKKEENIWKKISSCMPPLGLASLASFLERNNVEVTIIDAQAEQMALADIIQRIGRYNPLFIGITATTSIIDNGLEIARLCKEAFPESKVIMGGVHPMVMTEEVLDNLSVDFIVRGEGELALLDLVKGRDLKSIGGVSYKLEGKIYHNDDRPVIDNLDSLPFPAYHLLPMRKYYPALGAYKRLPAISMVTTRGCPGRCTFCYGGMLGKHIRHRSAQNIIEEIKLLKADYGIKEICFYDDTFTVFKDNVKQFCRLLIQDKINISWSCFSRVDFIDEETLKEMKEAGCHQIMYGIESADEGILKNINKRFSLEQANRIMALTKKVKIDVRAAFMFGSPGETEETMQRTINYAIKSDPDLVVFNITTPYPGTEMFKWAKDKGYLRTLNWEKYDLATAVMELPTVDSRTVEKYYKNAYKKFYLRPAYIIKRILRMKSLVDLMVNLIFSNR
jgi:anaerobic magnesium-protoporphyrin IX monomethyl ester cyclase